MITQKRKLQSRETSKSFSPFFMGLLILGIAAAILIPLSLARNLMAGGMDSGVTWLACESCFRGYLDVVE